MRAMKLGVVAHRRSDTNEALAAAASALGVESAVLSPRDALRVLEPGDVALGRLDVRESVDGMEAGTRELERLAVEGVEVLNPPAALVSAHDKLLTARALRLAGLPHPHTWLIAEGMPAPAPELPLVLKPRFGSWGRDVLLCHTHDELAEALTEISARSWFREQGTLAQELVPPQGWDLRVVVAGGRVVGAARRVAAPGEWRTNVALGGRRYTSLPSLEAGLAATSAAAAIGGHLVGVDLLPTPDGPVVLEVNGCVDFTREYSLPGRDVFGDAILHLVYPGVAELAKRIAGHDVSASLAPPVPSR
jgi:RimK family alpha-L-glutamate ligase